MFKDAVKRVNERWKTVTYWRNDVLVGRKCTKCGIDKQINEFNFYNKKESIYHSVCKECEKQYHKERPKKRKPIIVNEKGLVVKVKRGSITYWKDDVIVGRRCTKCGKDKEISEFKFVSKKGKYEARCKECERGYCKENAEHIKDYLKEYSKQYYQSNKEYIKQHEKQKYEIRKENNLKEILNLLEQVNPLFKQFNLPIYGAIYKIENIKTGRVYMGQTTLQLKERYGNNVVKSWIEERINRDNQKFKEELIEEDFKVTEVLDVGCCKWHLDKLEAYYIDQYDSCNDGYNIEVGNHNTDDGIEEFNDILKKYNLKFEGNKLIEI